MISTEKPTDKPDLKRETPGAIVEEAERPREVCKAELHSGDLVQVSTAHSTYSILVLEDGIYSVSGGWFDRQGFSPMETTITGCRRGRVINLGIVASCGLQLEFGNGVVTSRIQEIDVKRFGEHSKNCPAQTDLERSKDQERVPWNKIMTDREYYKCWRIRFIGRETEGKWSGSVELSIPYGPSTYSFRLQPRDDPFDTKEQAKAKAIIRAKDWIERDGQLRLSQIDPEYLPFKFRIGDRVSTQNGTAKGIIREGYYKSCSPGLGSYQIVYEVANGEGLFFKARQPELKKEAEEG